MEKLFVSDELLEARGKEYFEGVEYDDYKSLANDDTVVLEDGVILTRDDMYNLYLSLTEEDESFEEIESI